MQAGFSYLSGYQIGKPFDSLFVAEVLESNDASLAAGDTVSVSAAVRVSWASPAKAERRSEATAELGASNTPRLQSMVPRRGIAFSSRDQCCSRVYFPNIDLPAFRFSVQCKVGGHGPWKRLFTMPASKVWKIDTSIAPPQGASDFGHVSARRH
jgi:hypothetical protein